MKRFKPSEALKDKVVGLYLSNMPAPAIAESVRCSRPLVYKILRERSVACRLPDHYKVVGPLIEEVASLYESGATVTELGAEYGVSRAAITALLKRKGIVIRQPLKKVGRYLVNDSFFSSVDNEHAAYVLGFFTADGCIKGNRLHINLAEKDEEVLVKIKAALCSETPIRRRVVLSPQGKSRPQCCLAISSRQMVRDLFKLGVVERKSLIVEPWHGPDHLLPHYFRGLIDGDGSWVEASSGRRTLSLVGTLPVVEAFATFVLKRTGYTTSIRPEGKIWDARITSHPVIQHLSRILYNDATIYLKRKQQRAKAILELKTRPWQRRMSPLGT